MGRRRLVGQTPGVVGNPEAGEEDRKTRRGRRVPVLVGHRQASVQGVRACIQWPPRVPQAGHQAGLRGAEPDTNKNRKYKDDEEKKKLKKKRDDEIDNKRWEAVGKKEPFDDGHHRTLNAAVWPRMY